MSLCSGLPARGPRARREGVAVQQPDRIRRCLGPCEATLLVGRRPRIPYARLAAGVRPEWEERPEVQAQAGGSGMKRWEKSISVNAPIDNVFAYVSDFSRHGE